MLRPSLLQETSHLFLFTRLLGWLPARRRHDSGTLQIHSPWVVYSVLALSLQIGPTMYFLLNGIQQMSSMDPTLHMVSCMQLGGIATCQAIPLFAALQSRACVALWNDLMELQRRLEVSSVSRRPLTFGVCGLSHCVLALFWGPFLAILVLRPLVLGVRVGGTFDLFLALSFAHCQLLLGWWAVTTRAVLVAARRLAEEYQLLREYSEAGSSRAQLEVAAKSTRPLWLQLCGVVRRAGDAMGLAHQTLLLVSFCLILYSLYELLGLEQHLATSAVLLTFASHSFTMITVVCNGAHQVTQAVTQGILQSIVVTKHLRVSPTVQKELLLFFIHLGERSPEVKLNGYITVGRRFVTTLVAGMVANLVVLNQFKISNRKLEVKDFFTFGDDDSL